jgi:hypothetical protein
MTTPARPPSDLLLERYRLGELPADQMAAVAAMVAADAALQARMVALERSDSQILEQYPAAWMARRLRIRAHPAPQPATPPRSPLSRWWPVPVAAALLLAALPLLQRPMPGSHEDTLKGDAVALQLYRQTAAGSEALGDGDTVRDQERLQIAYRAPGRQYGVIFSIDSRGTLTPHLTAAATAAALVRQGADTLSHAYELDDCPGTERFYLVAADAPFAVAWAETAICRAATAGTARVDLPAGYDQTCVTLVKATVP